MAASLEDERFYVTRHVAAQTTQIASVASPLFLLGRSIYKRSFSLSSFLRNNAIGTFVIGGGTGVLLALGRMAPLQEVDIRRRAVMLRHNVSLAAASDYAIVGAILGTLLTTTVFLKRASLISNLSGGAAFGTAGGAITYRIRTANRKGKSVTQDLTGDMKVVTERTAKVIDDVNKEIKT